MHAKMLVHVKSTLLALVTFAYLSQVSYGAAADSASVADGQFQRVKAFIQARNQQSLPVGLLLGASNIEGDATNEAYHVTDAKWVFFDICGHDPAGRPHVEGDFNNPDCLQELATIAMGGFDQILVDDSTFKFTHWGYEHLECFYKMLKPGGTFVFCPELGSNSLRIVRCEDEKLDDIVRRMFADCSTELQTKKKLVAIGLRPVFLPVSDEHAVQEQEIASRLYKESILPHNKKILETIFGEGQVKLTENAEFPIKSRYKMDKTITLFTCTKK